MLRFYYDFLDKYVDWIDFEFIEMDIDSVYFVIFECCLDDIIKLDLKESYMKYLMENCNDEFDFE